MRIVATPIGNLADLSPRAREALLSADLIACEDTRRTGRLFQSLGTGGRDRRPPLLPLHDHNEDRQIGRVLERLEQGDAVALVSDAGTPLVSDPGYRLARAAVAKNIPVEALPGPSAILAALVVSGLPPYPFTFLGFPPPKQGKRRRFFEAHAEVAHTVVFFESPQRAAATLADAADAFGPDRDAALARELTKLHEEVLRGSLAEIAAQIVERGKLRGEVTVVVGGYGRRP
ncbi:MAG: 16S rRNA (cytidine(1402)-2'-O)-methyltransferase [Holophagales bacterium]|nr:16S rRNA (cytidine(1402)-2'-O)-methyltransferase [Holophagales bacterium]MYD20716.1 16S rRNA (cytidine(1402)-2'-O)-methyltransferase [Holophagales bacterium]MYI33609.1 16S rRNA (cytidine(1402)-2'-O)-methyltransferase [Holophagales bacterium]